MTAAVRGAISASTALLMTAIGLAGFILARVTTSTDTSLLGLVERLVEADRSSGIIAVGLVAATSILVAVLIPMVTVFAVLRNERRDAHDENTMYLDQHQTNGRLPDSKWLGPDPDHGRIDARHPADWPARQHPDNPRPDPRALGPKVSHHVRSKNQ